MDAHVGVAACLADEAGDLQVPARGGGVDLGGGAAAGAQDDPQARPAHSDLAAHEVELGPGVPAVEDEVGAEPPGVEGDASPGRHLDGLSRASPAGRAGVPADRAGHRADRAETALHTGATGRHDAPMDGALTTRGRPEGRQFGHWVELVKRSFVPLRPERPGRAGGAFRGEIALVEAGGLGVARIASEAQTVRRTRRDIADGPEGCPGGWCFVNVQLAGRSGVGTPGTEEALSPGDAVLLDAQRPFTMLFEANFAQLSLKVPRRVLDREVHWSPLHGRRLDGRDRATALLAAAAGPAAGPRAGRMLLEALAGAVEAAAPRWEDGGRAARLRHAALRHVEAHLADPDLSLGSLAQALGTSPRTVQAALAAGGVRYARHVAERRVARCLDALRREPHRTATEVALENGFSDPSTFARACRRTTSLSPRRAR